MFPMLQRAVAERVPALSERPMLSSAYRIGTLLVRCGQQGSVEMRFVPRLCPVLATNALNHARPSRNRRAVRTRHHA